MTTNHYPVLRCPKMRHLGPVPRHGSGEIGRSNNGGSKAQGRAYPNGMWPATLAAMSVLS
jgi:hypothetical protein